MRTRRNVPGVMVNFPRVMNDFFNDDFSSFNEFHRDYFKPAVNIKENDNEFLVDLITPGFTKEDFNIEVKEGKLNVSAEVKTEENNDTENYTHREFRHKSFKRSFVLPKDKADEEKIDAEYVNGILKLRISKKEEAKPKAPRLVEIK